MALRKYNSLKFYWQENLCILWAQHMAEGIENWRYLHWAKKLCLIFIWDSSLYIHAFIRVWILYFSSFLATKQTFWLRFNPLEAQLPAAEFIILLEVWAANDERRPYVCCAFVQMYMHTHTHTHGKQRVCCMCTFRRRAGLNLHIVQQWRRKTLAALCCALCIMIIMKRSIICIPCRKFNSLMPLNPRRAGHNAAPLWAEL